MSEKRAKARPQPGLKDKGKKRYEPPYLRKREKLAEVTGGGAQIVPPIIVVS